jgi:hypothetical protein
VLEGLAAHWVERVELGVAYPKIAVRIVELAKAAGAATVAVDAGGPGRPVIDMLGGCGLQVFAVTLTGGRLVRRHGNSISIPRASLMRPVVAAVENGQLQVARCPHAPLLAEELAALRQDSTGSIAGRGPGHHADLAVALAMGLWTQTLVRHGSRVETRC